jgi:biopolymer transport protein ExbB/TolQ
VVEGVPVALMLDACLNSWQANGCGWGMGYLWRSMGWLSRVDVGLLALMLGNTIVIICHRFYGHSAARRQSCTFVRDAAAALRDGKFDNVISVAARNSRSHVGTVIAVGLTAFASAPPEFTDIEAIDVAQRAFQRSRKMFAADLKLGIGTLSSIASSAPFIGLLGTVFGMMNAFGGSAWRNLPL